jgi:hypothetical protein
MVLVQLDTFCSHGPACQLVHSERVARRENAGIVKVGRQPATPATADLIDLTSAAVTLNRMNRDEFFAKLADLGEDRIKKALWNLYWRGPAQLRERIESELDPAEDAVRKRAAAEPPDPDTVLSKVRDFAELAKAGAYIAGDRRVSPKERTRWRLTFRRLATDAIAALRHEDSGPAEEAVALLIDLACETKRFDYFRSEDPMEAAQFVVSDAAATLGVRKVGPLRRPAAGSKPNRSGTDQPVRTRPRVPPAARHGAALRPHGQGSPAGSRSAARCASAHRLAAHAGSQSQPRKQAHRPRHARSVPVSQPSCFQQ